MNKDIEKLQYPMKESNSNSLDVSRAMIEGPISHRQKLPPNESLQIDRADIGNESNFSPKSDRNGKEYFDLSN